MVHLKIFTIITAVFMATVGYGQSYGKEETVLGADNISSVVKSSLNSIPSLRVGSVTDNFVYMATFISRKDEKTYAYNYAVFGKLSIDDVTITMSDGEMVTFKQEGSVLKTYHKLFVQSGYSGYELSIPVSIDGTSSVDGKNSSFTNQSLPTSTMINETDKKISTGNFEHSYGGKYININCTGLTQQSITNVKNSVERVRNKYDQLKKSQQDLQNHQNSGSNSSSGTTQTSQSNNSSNSQNNNTYSRNTNNNNSYNNSNRQRVDDYNERIRQQGDQIYRNTQTYSRNVDQIVGGVKNQFDQWHQNRMAAEEEEDDGEREETGLERRRREEAERAERERIEREARAAEMRRKDNLAESRKNILSKFPGGELPTSATRVNSNKLYYFVYTDAYDLREESPSIYVSNIFAIGQYPDGTWPMKTTVQAEINNLSNYTEYIHGYYTSEQEAQTALNNFKNEITSTGVRINNISYAGKNANVQQQSKADNKQQVLDYWGNPIKNTNTTQPQKTQPKQQEKKKPKLDYWGNPIKE